MTIEYPMGLASAPPEAVAPVREEVTRARFQTLRLRFYAITARSPRIKAIASDYREYGIDRLVDDAVVKLDTSVEAIRKRSLGQGTDDDLATAGGPAAEAAKSLIDAASRITLAFIDAKEVCSQLAWPHNIVL